MVKAASIRAREERKYIFGIDEITRDKDRANIYNLLLLKVRILPDLPYISRLGANSG